MPPGWSNIMVTPMQKHVLGPMVLMVHLHLIIFWQTSMQSFCTNPRANWSIMIPDWWKKPVGLFATIVGSTGADLYLFVLFCTYFYMYRLMYLYVDIFATIVEVNRGQIWDLEALKCPFSASLKYVLGSTEHHHHSSAMMGAFFACVWVKVLWEVRRPGL